MCKGSDALTTAVGRLDEVGRCNPKLRWTRRSIHDRAALQELLKEAGGSAASFPRMWSLFSLPHAGGEFHR